MIKQSLDQGNWTRELNLRTKILAVKEEDSMLDDDEIANEIHGLRIEYEKIGFSDSFMRDVLI
jgi:hypothetical protein